MNNSKKSLTDNFKAVEFENKKDKINKDIDRLLELYLNDEVPDSIKKSSIADKLKKKEVELKTIDKVIYELKNKEELKKLKEKRINSLENTLRDLKLGINKLDEIDWKRIIAKIIDRIEVDSQGRTTRESKLDLYIHNNFGNLEAEKITPRWANGGDSKPSEDLKNIEMLQSDLTDIEKHSFNLNLTFRKKIKIF